MVHASTKILVLLAALVAVAAGWWLLLANNELIPAVLFGSLWTIGVLVVTKVLFVIGGGLNRRKARQREPVTAGGDAGASLTELARLRDAGLISAEEFEAKRAKIVERL